MKLVQWVQFTWDLDKLPPVAVALPERYRFDLAGPEDEKELRTVVTRSLAHDSTWGEAIHEVNGMVDGWIERAFEPEADGVCLVLRHGARMIGAAILIPSSTAEVHLAPGPCVQMEYRNRGLGTALLGDSLRRLHDAGISLAVARAKSNGPVAKFLYPKFSGVVTPGSPPLLAA